MKLLKEMVENLINEDDTNAKINFHSYLTTKMKGINEMSEGLSDDTLKQTAKDFDMSLDKVKEIYKKYPKDFYKKLEELLDENK